MMSPMGITVPLLPLASTKVATLIPKGNMPNAEGECAEGLIYSNDYWCDFNWSCGVDGAANISFCALCKDESTCYQCLDGYTLSE